MIGDVGLFVKLGVLNEIAHFLGKSLRHRQSQGIWGSSSAGPQKLGRVQLTHAATGQSKCGRKW